MGKLTGKEFKIDDAVAAAAAVEDDRKEVINTTETLKEGAVEATPTLDVDEDAIFDEYNQPNASVAAVAAKYGIEPSEVFAIADRKNGKK